MPAYFSPTSTPDYSAMQLLRQALEQGSLRLNCEADSVPSIFAAAIDLAIERGQVPPEARDEVIEALASRERQGSTAIGNAVAAPHAYLDCLEGQLIVLLRLAHPVNLGAPDGIPTRFVFVLLGSQDNAAEHLDTLMLIARLMADEEFRYEARIARDPQQLLRALTAFEDRSRIPAPRRPAPLDDALAYTGQLCGGLVADWRRRWAVYKSDFTDGVHLKTLSSTLFLYFACLAPAITFGGIMAELTGNQIGAMEMIIGTAVCGVLFALAAGQPLIVLGGTGPLLVFTAILYQLTESYDLPFLETRACIGLWSGVMLLVLAATDASCLMRYFTRFTDEIFAALISIIFIIASIEALVGIFTSDTANHAKSFLSLLLALGTFYFAMSLSRFRRSRYLLPQMREFLADFGPTIALAAMTVIAVWMHEEVTLDVLAVPDTFRPTVERGWFVNPFAVDRWVLWASIGPAALVTVLVYMDQNITARLVNRADHKLQKGPAYHHDLALMGLLVGGSSLFGLPWLVAATVRSLNHVRSLATVEEIVDRTGDTRERIIHVRENRISGLAIHLLIGASLLLLPLLKFVPMAVLYGLFLFMGVVSMAGNQFFERLSLWLMDSSLYPSTHYTRRVARWTIHRFTFIQFVCLLALGLIEITPLAILFPLFIALLVPLRWSLRRFFSESDLATLDLEELPEEESVRYAE